MNTVKIEMPDLAFLMLLVGRRKSGKSSLCIDLLTNPKMLLGKFDKVILISPTADIDETWLNSSIDFNHPQITVYTEFKQEHIAEIISEQRLSIDLNGSDNADDVLLILDDCLADSEFRQKGQNHLFKIANNGRHLKISIIILAQKITGIPEHTTRLFY